MKVVFLLESISQPRCIKRINSFISNGYDVEIYGIDRGKYSENVEILEKKINIIAKQAEGKDYTKRFFYNIKWVKEVLYLYKQENVIFYSFGFMLTLSLKINGCKNYIYEIADIMYGYKKLHPFVPILKLIDKNFIKSSLLTVMTSDGFANFFYNDHWPNNILIQRNKLDKFFNDVERPNIINNKGMDNIVFSYVGSFRYPDTVFRFAKIIGEFYPQHEFHFYGDSVLVNEVINICKKYNNVKYFGPFKNPDDLSKIYNKIDIVVACYETQNLNERIAEPNKLYESLFFKKPIIVSENTYLSEKVKRLDCGYIINAYDNESIIKFINTLDVDKNERIINNISEINKYDIIDDDSVNIISYIQSLYL